MSQTISLFGWKVALIAMIRFLFKVDNRMPLQIKTLAEWFLTHWTFVCLHTVHQLMSPKSRSTCKCLWTLVARLTNIHDCWIRPLSSTLGWWLRTVVNIEGNNFYFHKIAIFVVCNGTWRVTFKPFQRMIGFCKWFGQRHKIPSVLFLGSRGIRVDVSQDVWLAFSCKDCCCLYKWF